MAVTIAEALFGLGSVMTTLPCRHAVNTDVETRLIPARPR
jgi:hypothetical protein